MKGRYKDDIFYGGGRTMGIFSKSNTSKVHLTILEQIKDVEGCLVSFNNFMKAAVNPKSDIEMMRALAESVYHMESAADRSLRAMIDSLNNVAYLPATRSELIDIAAKCDKIANKCEHVAEMMVLQHFKLPAEYSEQIVKILEITKEQFAVLLSAIGKLFSKVDFLWKESISGSYAHASEEFYSKVDRIILLAGLYNNNKELFNALVEASEKYDIPIVLVRPQGLEEVPLELEEKAATIVGWNANCIIDSIKDADELV